MMVNKNFTVLASDATHVKINKVLLSRLNDALHHADYEISLCEFEHARFIVEYRTLNIAMSFRQGTDTFDPLNLFPFFSLLYLEVMDQVNEKAEPIFLQSYHTVLKLMCRFVDEYCLGGGMEEDIAYLGDVDALNRRLQTEFPMNYAA